MWQVFDGGRVNEQARKYLEHSGIVGAPMGRAFLKFFFPFQKRPLDDENDYESAM